MIRKSFATAITLLILHGLAVWHRPQWNFSEYQWQDNIVKAQHYIYQDTNAENIIVGSSLAWHLVKDSLPGIYNFSFGGGSIFDGLSILKNNSKLPKNIYVETNVVTRGENTKFTENLNSPLFYRLRKLFPQFREGYQPITMMSNVVITHNIIKRTLRKLKSAFHFDKERDEQKKRLAAEDIKLQTMLNSKAPSPEILLHRFNYLQELVSYFEDRGTRIVFFEMPVDKVLSELPDAKAMREGFSKNFPDAKNAFIHLPDSAEFETADGSHLTDPSARKYSSYLKKEIDRLKN